MSEHNNSRRDFLKKTAYVAPVILTLSATPAFARPGSHCDNGVGNGSDCRPGKAYFNNDDEGGTPHVGTPGDPGSQHGYKGGNSYDH